MAVSSLHMLSFSLLNPYTLSLDRDGPFFALYRLLTVASPSIYTLDLSQYAGLTILITGATSGCGLECAKALSRAGCHLILTSRDQKRGEEIKQEILQGARAANAPTTVSIVELDMTSFQSLRLLPSRLQELVDHLDVVILNAAVYQTEFSICSQTGWELMIQVNVLATCALTLIFRPYLSRAQSGRLLIVSSEAHAWAQLRSSSSSELLSELNKAHSYPCYQRYHITKLLVILWGRELSRREEWKGVSVAAVSPGFSRSRLFRDFNGSMASRALERVVCRTSEKGASQYMLALHALAPGVTGRCFWSDGMWRR